VDYAASAYFRAAASGRTTAIYIRWYNSGGTTVSTSTGDTGTDVTTGFTRVSTVATAPATAAYAAVRVEVQSTGGASEVHYVDSVLLEKSPVVGDYFDGSMSRDTVDDYVWAGTAHGSISAYYPDRILRTSRLTGTATDYTPYGVSPVLMLSTTPPA
jgi:hypothetical protein